MTSPEIDAVVAKERADIAAWLRKLAEKPRFGEAFLLAALLIENGEHARLLARLMEGRDG